MKALRKKNHRKILSTIFEEAGGKTTIDSGLYDSPGKSEISPLSKLSPDDNEGSTIEKGDHTGRKGTLDE